MREFLGVKSRDTNDEQNKANEKIDADYNDIRVNVIEANYENMYKERVISNIRLDMEKIAGADKEGDHEGGSKR